MSDTEPSGLGRLSHEIRRFIAMHIGNPSRLSTMAKLYLEFATVSDMLGVHGRIMREMEPYMRMSTDPQGFQTVNEDTVKIDYGGISIILTCKQRFVIEDQPVPIGYASMRFANMNPFRDAK